METIKEVVSLVVGLAIAVLIFGVLYAGYNVMVNLTSGAPLMTNL